MLGKTPEAFAVRTEGGRFLYSGAKGKGYTILPVHVDPGSRTIDVLGFIYADDACRISSNGECEYYSSPSASAEEVGAYAREIELQEKWTDHRRFEADRWFAALARKRELYGGKWVVPFDGRVIAFDEDHGRAVQMAKEQLNRLQQGDFMPSVYYVPHELDAVPCG